MCATKVKRVSDNQADSTVGQISIVPCSKSFNFWTLSDPLMNTSGTARLSLSNQLKLFRSPNRVGRFIEGLRDRRISLLILDDPFLGDKTDKQALGTMDAIQGVVESVPGMVCQIFSESCEFFHLFEKVTRGVRLNQFYRVGMDGKGDGFASHSHRGSK